MRIAICEDNREHAEILQGMVERWAAQENMKIDIGYYQSAEQFLFMMKDEVRYDLVFLDIQMGKMNGLQLAKRIRKEDKTIVLIFTTGSKDYAVKGYEVSALRYLVKPLQQKEVDDALTKVNRMLEQSKKEAVIVSSNSQARRIYKNDIWYVEVDDHYIVIHTKEEVIRFKAKMKEFEQHFPEPQFCKCHRSYIVNLHFVTKISKDGVLVENGEVLPISRSRWTDLNRCYMVYYTM